MNVSDEHFLETQETMVSPDGCVIVSQNAYIPCDHVEGIFSPKFKENFNRVVYIGFIPLAFFVGAVTNILNCLIFSKQGLGDRINMCLFSLALSDLVYLTVITVRNLEKLLSVIVGKWIYTVWVQKLIQYRLIAAHSGVVLVSNFISSLISVERCVCVVSPLKARAYLSTRNMLILIICGSCLILVGTQFIAFMFDVTCAVYVGPDQNFTDFLIIASDVYRHNKLLMDVLDTFVFASVVPVTSVLVMSITTVITGVKLRTVLVQREKLTTSQILSHKEAAVTRMLIVTSGIYIACVSPRVMESVAQFIVPELRVWGKFCNIVVVVDTTMNALLAFHSTVNFFVYFAMGTRFRCLLKALTWSSLMSNGKATDTSE